jgi:hypothetical protein
MGLFLMLVDVTKLLHQRYYFCFVLHNFQRTALLGLKVTLQCTGGRKAAVFLLTDTCVAAAYASSLAPCT